MKKTDAELMSGGPTEPTTEPTKTEKPAVSTIEIGGKEFTVTPEMKEAFEKESTKPSEQDATIAAMQARLDQLSQTPPTAPTPVVEEELDPLDPDFSKKLKAQLRKEIQQENQNTKDEMLNFYQRDKNEVAMWNQFYKDNDDLDRGKHDFIVKAVMQQHAAMLGPMETSAALKMLGDKVRKELVSLVGKVKNEDKVVLEGPSTPSHEQTTPSEDAPKVVSMSDQIKQRKAERMRTRVAKKD